MKSSFSWNSSGGVVKGTQPVAKRAVRFSAGSASAPIQIGMCGFCTGLGSKTMSRKDTNSPSNSGRSLVHSSIIAARYSSAMRPRFSNGTPMASNSPFSQPTPKAMVRRPPLSQSIVASALAISTAGCSGRMVTDEPTRIRWVAPKR
jgi:hypothetical protein